MHDPCVPPQAALLLDESDCTLKLNVAILSTMELNYKLIYLKKKKIMPSYFVNYFEIQIIIATESLGIRHVTLLIENNLINGTDITSSDIQ